MGCREGSAAKSVEDEDSFPFPCEWIGCSGNDSPSVLDYDSPEDAPPFPEAGSFEPYVQGRMCARPPPARSRELGSSGLASGSGPAGRPAAHMWLQLDLEARARRASRVRTTRIRFGLRLFAQQYVLNVRAVLIFEPTYLLYVLKRTLWFPRRPGHPSSPVSLTCFTVLWSSAVVNLTS